MTERYRANNRPDFDHIANEIVPGSQVISATELQGGVSAIVTGLMGLAPDGRRFSCIVRQYGAADLFGNRNLAVHEFRLLEHLALHEAPVPIPLIAESSREVAGAPYLVVTSIAGSVVMDPPDPGHYLERLAEGLTRIHAIDGTADALSFLQDGSVQARNEIRMCKDFPMIGGKKLRYWKILAQIGAPTPRKRKSLLHGDFWPGNVLWSEEEIAGVIDWEDAVVGDPLEDVANCQLELDLLLGESAADHFFDAYLRLNPKALLTNKTFWDLYVAARARAKIPQWDLGREEKTAMITRVDALAEKAIRKLPPKRY